MRLVWHRNDLTSPSGRLMSGYLLHFQPLEGADIVLSDVVQRVFRGKTIEHILRLPRQ